MLYERILKQEAWEDYRQASFINALGGGKTLELPPILRS